MVKEKWSDLILESNNYDAIAHGCNCFNTMGGGIAYGISKSFPEARVADAVTMPGDINKLGNIEIVPIKEHKDGDIIATVVNCYTQFKPGQDVSYSAIDLCLRKLNSEFKGKHIALPQIGCGIAGGLWSIVKQMIEDTMIDCDVTIIYWDKEREQYNNQFPK